MARKLKIGILCHPTYGGSGVVASELALSLADAGHCVHLFSHDVPPRLARSPGPVVSNESMAPKSCICRRAMAWDGTLHRAPRYRSPFPLMRVRVA